MASSSVNSRRKRRVEAGEVDLRFGPTPFCNCKKKAAIKVVESETKMSRGIIERERDRDEPERASSKRRTTETQRVTSLLGNLLGFGFFKDVVRERGRQRCSSRERQQRCSSRETQLKMYFERETAAVGFDFFKDAVRETDSCVGFGFFNHGTET